MNECMLGEKVKHSCRFYAPLDPGDHPELDDSDLCDDEKIKYMSMVGSLQWVLAFGRVDIGTATMTMSRFHIIPRKGHLACLKCIYCYLTHFKNSSIKFNMEVPDYNFMSSGISLNEQFFMAMVLVCKGKPIVMTSNVDANVLHDYVTGISYTGIIHLFIKTLMNWFSKLQSNVKTAAVSVTLRE